MEKVKSSLIEWGVASRTLSGQSKSGDMHLVKLFPLEALVAVVDGIGHGEEAAVAAQIAISTLELCAGEPLMAMVNRCHEVLRPTRGVVLSLAAFRESDSTMAWLGVGNVEGLLIHESWQTFPERENLLLKGGVVGDHLPLLATSSLAVGQGDLLIFTTDGVQPGFADQVPFTGPPQQIADRILARHCSGTDDALVLVVRCVHGKDPVAFR